MKQKHKPVIAIIGSSFAGLSVVLRLRKRLGNKVTIKLFDMQKEFCYIPALHNAILAPKKRLKKAMFSLKKYYPKEFIYGKVTKLDTHSLEIESGEKYNFDYCVIATGSYAKYINHPDRSQYGFPVRYAEDIPKLNKKLTDPKTKKITIVGGGFTGIEVASIIAERKRADQTVTIIHSRDRLLHYFDKNISTTVQKWFDAHKIQSIFNTKVNAINKNSIILNDGSDLSSDATIVSAGVNLNNEIIPKEFTFNENYNAHQADNMFICGDVAAHGLYTTAHNAIMEGRRVGDLIADSIEGITGEYHTLLNRQILGLALGSKDGLILNGKKGYSLPWITGFSKRCIEQRVLLEFKYKIMFWI